MRVVLQVHEDAEVEFKDDTWYRELGFEKKVYKPESTARTATQASGVVDMARLSAGGLFLAPNIADIVKGLNILIRSNLSLDWVFKGKRTNILYNISNSVAGGQMLVEKPNPVKRVVPSNKEIHEIVLQFETEDGVGVDFNGEEFVLTLIIERM